ncbi:MAG: DUF222 domain-containing protein [Longimicrobiales bacterium]|nr:DUF222 domain-containing protein [Longimicrobiales bacterium]
MTDDEVRGGEMEADLDPATVEAEARASRVDRVAVLYAQITAATREFLAAVAECDRHGDWAAEGFGSCAEWLAWRVGLRRNAANERVRVARALETLPRTSEAMALGELSFSKVRALTRVATADNETELLELAKSGSTAHLERVVRAWKALSREDEAKREQVLHRTRRFSVFPDEDGMYVVRGRLTPEVASVLLRAVESASDALFGAADEEERRAVEPAQRRADALGLLAERALAAGMASDDAPVSGSRAERYQVLLHVEPETLSESGEPGMSELEDGTRVSAETARRLACDASVVPVVRGSEGREAGRRGTVLDMGRRRRSVPPALRRALEARDRGCRFPGCGGRFTDAHHIRHWADGGETKLSNLVLLCRRHHRRVHEDGWRVCSDRSGTQIVFFKPTGEALEAAPPLAPRPKPRRGGAGDRRLFEEFMRRLAEREVDPDWRTNLPRHRWDSNIPWSVEAAAWEALEESAA